MVIAFECVWLVCVLGIPWYVVCVWGPCCAQADFLIIGFYLEKWILWSPARAGRNQQKYIFWRGILLGSSNRPIFHLWKFEVIMIATWRVCDCNEVKSKKDVSHMMMGKCELIPISIHTVQNNRLYNRSITIYYGLEYVVTFTAKIFISTCLL